MRILICSENPEYAARTTRIFGKSIQEHMETPISYQERTLTLNDNWRWMYWLWLWDQYFFQAAPGLLVLAHNNFDCYRSTPETRCWYPQHNRDIHLYPGYDHDEDIRNLRYFSGSTGKQITTHYGTQRGPCDEAAAIAYLVYCQKEGIVPAYPPIISRIGQTIASK
jgi:hypothetical protein